jgi:two-component system, response regulator RpfG
MVNQGDRDGDGSSHRIIPHFSRAGIRLFWLYSMADGPSIWEMSDHAEKPAAEQARTGATTMFPIFDVIEGVGTLGGRINVVHSFLKAQPQASALSRISLAHYEARSDLVRTLAFSNDADLEVNNISLPLREVPSLALLAESRSYRKVDDITAKYDLSKDHSQGIVKTGIRSSLTFPIRSDGRMLGFVFMNSREPAYFTQELVEFLSPYVAILSMMMIDELDRIARNTV